MDARIVFGHGRLVEFGGRLWFGAPVNVIFRDRPGISASMWASRYPGACSGCGFGRLRFRFTRNLIRIVFVSSSAFDTDVFGVARFSRSSS